MRKCDFCGAPNPEERIECRSCGNPVRRPEPPSLLTDNSEGASAYFHIDRQSLADSPEEERAALARVRAELQAEERNRKRWWRRFVRE
jgi:hypothetical protein